MKYQEIQNPQQLLEYMAENINYGFVSKDNKIYINQDEQWNENWYDNCIVQDPLELMNNHYGTCWDQVELERKWFEENKYKIKTLFLIFSINKPNNYPTHSFLLFEQKGKIFWFEHSFENVKGIHEFNTECEAIEAVKSKQLEYAISMGIAKPSDKDILQCVEFSKPKTNIVVYEYLKHVVNGNKL